MMKRMALIALLIFTIATAGRAQVEADNRGSFSGTVFMDYYWIAANHNENLEGRNGFWFRRIYLTYDRQLGKSFDARLRLEMSNPGDFLTNSKLGSTVKDAWLRWSNDRHALIAGIAPTPTWGLVEDAWGYRSVEKTPVDLHGMGGSRDFGLAARGTLDPAGSWSYHFMVGNGTGRGTEIDKGKKLMLSLSYQLTEHLVMEVYGDWNDRPAGRDHLTLQGFAGYQSDTFTMGALFAHQYRKARAPIPDVELNLASLFARGSFSDAVSGFFRVDHMFNPNPGGESTSYIPFSDQVEYTFLVGGVDYRVHENIHLIPNIEAVVYGEAPSGETPDSDLIPRLTLFFTL